jgi:hypothetical protein
MADQQRSSRLCSLVYAEPLVLLIGTVWVHALRLVAAGRVRVLQATAEVHCSSKSAATSSHETNRSPMHCAPMWARRLPKMQGERGGMKFFGAGTAPATAEPMTAQSMRMDRRGWARK